MKKFAVVAAAVLLANIVNIDRAFEAPLSAQDRVAEVVAQVRKALGGDKLTAARGISAEGPFRRSMGQRDMEGTLSLVLMRPDKLRRSEEMSMGGMVGGPTVERVSAFNGTDAWDDIQNRGGMGGGMQMVIRGPDGPGGPGRPGGPLTEEQINEQRTRRMKMELQRWTVALFADSSQPFTDGGVAASTDGKADVLETKDEAGRAVRLFIDQQTHLPLMVQYMEIRPRIMMTGGPGGPGGRGGGSSGGPGAPSAPGAPPPPGTEPGATAPPAASAPADAPAGAPSAGRATGGRPMGPDGQPLTEEQMRARIEEMRKQGPPQPSQFAMHLGDYKNVDGIMLPHKIDISIDGQPNEEWTIEKFRVNPSVKTDEFNKPKS